MTSCKRRCCVIRNPWECAESRSCSPHNPGNPGNANSHANYANGWTGTRVLHVCTRGVAIWHLAIGLSIPLVLYTCTHSSSVHSSTRVRVLHIVPVSIGDYFIPWRSNAIKCCNHTRVPGFHPRCAHSFTSPHPAKPEAERKKKSHEKSQDKKSVFSSSGLKIPVHVYGGAGALPLPM